MRKKLLCAILSVVMIAGMIPLCTVPATAEEHADIFGISEGEMSFEFVFNAANIRNGLYSDRGTLFTILAPTADSEGMSAGNGSNPMVISCSDSTLTITRIEAVVNSLGSNYAGVGATGTKLETGSVANGTTVHVTNVNASQFSFSGGTSFCKFGNVTVYYTHAHDFSGDCADNGDGTHSRRCIGLECDETGSPEAHTFTGECVANTDGTHTGTCSVCGPVTAEHVYTYTANGDGTHTAACTACGHAVTTPHDLTYTDNGNGTHTAECGACDYTETTAHDVVYELDDEATHTGRCVCGYQTEKASHVLTCTDNGNGTHTSVCSACNFAATRAHDNTFTHNEDGTHTAVCSACGHTETNEHFFVYTINEDGTHTAVCYDCNLSYTSEHVYGIYVINGDGTHTESCSECHYTRTVSHKLVKEDNGDGTHTERCACGKEGVTEAHAPAYQDNGDGTHTGDCVCGYTETAMHTFIGTDNGGNGAGVCICGVKSSFEKLVYDRDNIQSDGTYLFEGEHFIVSANNNAGEYGIKGGGGSSGYWVKVKAKSDDLTVTRIDAVIVEYPELYNEVGITRGRKYRDTDIEVDDTVNVLDVDSNAFAFAGGSNFGVFKDITVYYTVENHRHDFSVNASDNGDGTHTGECSVCGIVGEEAHAPAYQDNGDGTHTGDCVCGYTETAMHTFIGTDNGGNGAGTCVCGVNSSYEKLAFNAGNIMQDGSYLYNGLYFSITADSADSDGIKGGSGECRIKIKANSANVTVTRVDAVISTDEDHYEEVGISKGTKFGTDIIENGSAVSVLAIGSNIFSFAGGSNYCRFKDITVYYTVENHDHDFSVNASDNGDGTHTGECSVCGIVGEGAHDCTLECADNGDGTHTGKCSACGASHTEEHSMTLNCTDNGNGTHSGKCSVCNATADVEHIFTYTDNKNGTHTGVCICGNTKTENCSFVNNFCTVCNAPKEQTEKLTFGTSHIKADYSYVYETQNFRVTAYDPDVNGMLAGREYEILIEAKRKDITIRSVDAVVSKDGRNYYVVRYGRGTNMQENQQAPDGSTVTVTKIDSDSLRIYGMQGQCCFSDFTVHYVVENHEHDFSVVAANQWKNDPGFHTMKCKDCDTVREERHSFNSDCTNNYDGTHTGTCACGKTGTEAHDFSERVDNGDGTYTFRCPCGETVLGEVLKFKPANISTDGHYTYAYQGKNVKITADYANSKYGMELDDYHPMKIEATNPRMTITRIDALVSYYGANYGYVEPDHGRKAPTSELYTIDGRYVSIIDVDSDNCTIAYFGNDYYYFCRLRDFIVYYTDDGHEHDFTGRYVDNGDGTHSRECLYCDKLSGDAEEHIFTGDCENNGDCTHTGTCLCGISGTEIHRYDADGVCVCGDEVLVEKLVYSQAGLKEDWSYVMEGDHFVVTAKDGHSGLDGGAGDWTRIMAKDPHIVISRVDTELTFHWNCYSAVGISSGTKVQTGMLRFGDIPNVINVDSNFFAYEGGDAYIEIGDMTVYYKVVDCDHSFTADNVEDNGNGTHTGICADCGALICMAHDYAESITDNGDGTHTFNCVCGASSTPVSHVYISFTDNGNGTHNRSCICGNTAAEEHELSYTDSSDSFHTASCKCGYETTGEHVYTSFVDNGDGTHSSGCVCGRLIGEKSLHVFEDGVCVCGTKTRIETFVFDENYVRPDLSYLFNGENIRITATRAYVSSLYGGDNDHTLKLEAIKDGVNITRVDAVVIEWGSDYGKVGINRGRKFQDGMVVNGSTVNVIDIDSDSFAFTGGTTYIRFDNITVYYTMDGDDHDHSFGAFTDNGNGTYTAVCECGEELTVTASYEYYFVNGQKPVAGGENGTVNKRAYYIDDKGTKVELERGLLEEDLDVTFAEWYLRTAVQFRKTEDGGVNVRFVSMLDDSLENYFEAGFTYTAGGADSFDPLTTQFGNTSYIADSKTVKAGDFGLGEEYFILRDVDFAKEAVDADLEISVTPYVLLADEENYVTGEAVSFRLGDLVKAA